MRDDWQSLGVADLGRAIGSGDVYLAGRAVGHLAIDDCADFSWNGELPSSVAAETLVSAFRDAQGAKPT